MGLLPTYRNKNLIKFRKNICITEEVVSSSTGSPIKIQVPLGPPPNVKSVSRHEQANNRLNNIITNNNNSNYNKTNDLPSPPIIISKINNSNPEQANLSSMFKSHGEKRKVYLFLK